MKKGFLTVLDGSRIKYVKEVNSGSEGKICVINRRWAVKIYHITDSAKIEKVKALIGKINHMNFWDRRFVRKHLAVPVSVINDCDGNEIGFKMRRISKRFKDFEEMFLDNSRYYEKRFVYACKLAKTAQILHRNGIFIGDFNRRNFLADKKGNFRMVDADTVDFEYGGKHYKCTAYFPESVSNETLRMITKEFERYKSDPEMRIFDEVSDDYSLAYTVFKLIALGSPYACVPAEKPERVRIEEGICPIYRKDEQYSVPGYVVNKKHFGIRLNKLFKDIFIRNKHVRAGKLCRALNSRRKLFTFQFRTIRTYDGEKVF